MPAQSFAPTLAGENWKFILFLAHIFFHGHAHRGVEKSETYGGVPVRNGAQPVIRHVCNIYTLNKEGLSATSDVIPYTNQPRNDAGGRYTAPLPR